MSIKAGTWVAAACLLSASIANAVVIETVPVGNPGNAADTRYDAAGFGAVDYTYSIGKYEVTAGQYTEFLNAVAGVDAYGLYNPNMWSSQYGCKIERSGGGTATDLYTYTVAGEYAKRPVNYVSFWDSCRFANWLHNGQPSGTQDISTTEDGAYTLTAQGIINNTVTRNGDWQWAVTSEDEWYKAAYYGPATGSYYDYPTVSNSVPSNDLINPDPGNNANFNQGGYTIGAPYWTTEVGEFENSESPYGTCDQGGNVWEWNEAVLSGSSRGLRGGSFGDYGRDLCASERYITYPVYKSFGIGFRVVKVRSLADFNGDGAINAIDLLMLARSFPTSADDPNYNPLCDMNGDGLINAIDLLMFAHRWNS